MNAAMSITCNFEQEYNQSKNVVIAKSKSHDEAGHLDLSDTRDQDGSGLRASEDGWNTMKSYQKPETFLDKSL